MAGTSSAPGIVMAANFAQLGDLDPVLTDIFYQQYNLIKPVRPALFRELSSNKAKETDLRIGSFSDPEPFTGQINYESVMPDYDVTYTHTQFAKGFKVERQMLDDQQYEPIFTSASEMGTAFARKVEKDAASVFNNAMSASFLGYDGDSLCDADHALGESNSTTTSNLGALALSKANVDTGRQAMRAFVDDQGELISVNPDILLVPPELETTGFEIVKSLQDPTNANNAANPFYNRFNLVVWDYLTDANRWFLIDSVLAKKYLKWYWRVKPEFGAEQDFDTFQRKYRGYMRYSYGWSDWRWVYGSEPS